MESEFPKMEKSLYPFIKFLEIMKDNNLIYWKGEEKNNVKINSLRPYVCRCHNDHLRMGLWRTMHQKQDLSNMLCSKGISKVKKALKKNKVADKKELEPFVKDLTAKQPFNSERIGVTDPNAFLDSILPYMLKQKMIKEIREDKKVVYQLNK